MWCETKQTTVETKIRMKHSLTRMELQSANLKQLLKSNFNNNLCQKGNWRKEKWTKYNNIHLQKITSIEINQTGLI